MRVPQLLSVTSHLIKKRKWMRPFTDNWKQPHRHRLWFNHPDICWRSHTAKYKHSRRFLESTPSTFLVQVVEELARNYVQLKQKRRVWLEMWSEEKVLAAVTMRSWCAASFKEGRRVLSTISAPDYRRTNFALLGHLLGGIPWHLLCKACWKKNCIGI